jgi:starvation-inducible DNA-binding protein
MTTSPKAQTQVQVKSYPAPSPLATQTDLKSEEVQAITEAINPLIADAFALYTKTKNYHWHVAGSHFREYHKLFDQQAEAILECIDALAERVRRVGGTTIRSISHINQLQTIQDDNSDYVPAGQMAQRLMEDNKRMAQMQRAAHEVCQRCHDVATASVLETLVDATERRTWYLFEVVQGMNNAD